MGPKRTKQWHIEWVEDMPERMEAGKLYISVKHQLIEHLCACGCGAEVSLPVGRSEWHLIYSGDSVSVWPSIGNWRLPCKSHYVIQDSKTRWRSRWTDKQILAGRKRDRQDKLLDIQRNTASQSWFRRFLALIGFKK